MFAGHVGAALAIGRAERRVNPGVFVASALLLDIVLWLFVLLGWESVTIPADFASTHQVAFDFPWSHSLAAGIGWSALAAFGAWFMYPDLNAGRWRAAALVATAVFSHWLLDALVHRPEMPIAGAGTYKVGLGLWRNLPIALLVEAAIVVAGLFLFVPGSRWSRRRSIGLATLCAVILAFTVLGMTLAPPPPSAQAMAGSSLVTLIVVSALVYWLGRPGSRGES